MSFTVARPTFLDAPQQQEKQPGFMEMLGAGLGQGIAGGIQQQVKQSALNKVLEQAQPGMTPMDVFKLGSQLPEEQQKPFYQAYQDREAAVKKKQHSTYQKNAMNFVSQNIKPEMSSLEKFQIISQLPPEQQAYGFDALDRLGKAEKIEAETGKIRGEIKDKESEGKALDRQIMRLAGQDKRIIGEESNGLEKEDKAALFEDLKNYSPEEKKQIIEDMRVQRKEQQDENKIALVETKDFRKGVKEDYKNYRSTKMHLDRMEQLNEKGDLNTPVMAKLMDKINIPAFLSPDSQEFDKLSKDMMKDIKSFFGARINQFEVQNFLKTIPTLTQSKEGRARVINNLKSLVEAQNIRYNTYKEIMKGRKYPPLDLEDMVNERSEEKLDQIAEDFKSKISSPEEQQERPLQVKKKPEEVQPLNEDKKTLLGSIKESFTPGGEEELGTARGVRDVTRAGSRVAETIAGFPGDVVQLGNSLLPKKEGNIFVESMKDTLGVVGSVLPTSEQLKKFSEFITGGYTSPKSKTESIADEIVSDAASLGSGGAGIAKSLGVASIGTAAKYGTGLLTENKGKQEAAKVGTMVLASLINPKRSAGFVKSLYDDAKTILPEKASVATRPIKNSLKEFNTSMAKGGVQPTQFNLAKKASKDMEGILKGKNVNVENLLQAKVNLNTELSRVWDKAERKELMKVKKIIDDGIASYGSKNPEFIKKYKTADSAYGALQNSKKMMNSLKKVSNKYKLGPTSALAEAGLLYSGGGIGPAVAGGIGYGSLKLGEAASRFAKDPSWRRYYIQTMNSALKDNIPQTAKNLSKLNKKTEELNKGKKQ